VPARLLSPGASTAGVHPDDLSAEFPGRAAVVAVVLDRPRVGSSTHLSQHPDNPDHHDSEQRPAAQHAGRLLHQGHRRLDGDLPGLRVRRVH